MSRLIRMDRTGHTVVAEWTAEDAASVEAAVVAFRRELESGALAMVTTGPGHAEQVTELPIDADQVILRRPIAGG
jgi:mRNA-degrading endonuclease toxin of MazEF toxin-antitoxin module